MQINPWCELKISLLFRGNVSVRKFERKKKKTNLNGDLSNLWISPRRRLLRVSNLSFPGRSENARRRKKCDPMGDNAMANGGKKKRVRTRFKLPSIRSIWISSPSLSICLFCRRFDLQGWSIPNSMRVASNCFLKVSFFFYKKKESIFMSLI